MTSEDSDGNRNKKIRALEHRYKQAQAKAFQLKAEAVQAERQHAELETAVRRAQAPLLDPKMCLECWLDYSDPKSEMVMQSSGGEKPLHCPRGHVKELQSAE